MGASEVQSTEQSGLTAIVLTFSTLEIH